MCSDIADREVKIDAVTPGDRAARVGHESGLKAHAYSVCGRWPRQI